MGIFLVKKQITLSHQDLDNGSIPYNAPNLIVSVIELVATVWFGYQLPLKECLTS